MKPEEILEEIYRTALDAVDPFAVTKARCRDIQSFYNSSSCEQLFLIAFGKASVPMAAAVQEGCGDLITAGVVITKDGHLTDIQGTGLRPDPRIQVFEASHPIPDDRGVIATNAALDLISKVTEKTLVICLISGGGSALFVSPVEGITLAEKQHITELLLKSGATIGEINTVRKELSRVKGGRLASACHPAPVLSFILSDVIGDRLDVIASGPTAPTDSNHLDAVLILQKYGIKGRLSLSLLEALLRSGAVADRKAPSPDSDVFKKVRNIVIGSNALALGKAREKAMSLGYDAEIVFSDLEGEARNMGAVLAQKALLAKASKKRHRKVCLLSGGETTVTVRGDGRGGRNTELALAFASEVDGIPGIFLLSAGTDGTDGPTDAAGAFANGETITRARQKNLDAERYLHNNDSYTFFQNIGHLFFTGPTGTNVMDIQIILIE